MIVPDGLIAAWRNCHFKASKESSNMRATARSVVLGFLAVVLGSCAWQMTTPDHAHVLSQMADTAARDSAKCQSSGAALGSEAYKKCRALLEDKMSLEKDFPVDRTGK
jgi:hypothetical protein